MTIDLLAPFLIGLFGSLHCLGMCGPLVMAYSLHIKNPETRASGLSPSPWGKGFFHHLAYHLGRLTTYGILGALAAGLFQTIGLNLFLNVRGVLILAGGALITILGLVFLRVVPLPTLLSRFSLAPHLMGNRLLPSLFKSPVPISKMALGLTKRPPALLSIAFHAHQGGHNGKYGRRIYDHGGLWPGHGAHPPGPWGFCFPADFADQDYRGKARSPFNHRYGPNFSL